jgi:DNA/RNA-binding domain of Phe-tRNA-synthetase-like protein
MRNVANPDHHAALDQRKGELEDEIRARFADHEALLGLAPIQAYRAYYKRYTKTYHVQLQIESIARKGKTIPRVAALVEAMFMAELKNLLLTAGHDLEAIQPPVKLDVANGDERYVLLNGQEQVLKPADMMMADAQGVICSVLYGMDYRTRITRATRQVLFVVYAPPGIGEEAVRRHLLDIQSYVELVGPAAAVVSLDVYGTG